MVNDWTMIHAAHESSSSPSGASLHAAPSGSADCDTADVTDILADDDDGNSSYICKEKAKPSIGQFITVETLQYRNLEAVWAIKVTEIQRGPDLPN